MDARWAPFIAWARGDESAGLPKKRFDPLESLRGKTDPAGIAVVDENSRATGLRMGRVGDAADIVAVADRQQREKRDGGMFGSVDRSHEVQTLLGRLLPDVFGNFPPHADRLVDDRRQVEGMAAHLLLIGYPPPHVFLELLGDTQTAQADPVPGSLPRGQSLEDLGLLLRKHLRVVVQIDTTRRHAPALAIQFDDLELLPLVQVDRAHVAFGECAHAIHGADHPLRVGGHDRVAAADRPQIHFTLGVASERVPGFAVRAGDQTSIICQLRNQFHRLRWIEFRVGFRDRDLGPGADQVLRGDHGIAGVGRGALEIAAEELRWISHEVLIERVRQRHQADKRLPFGSSHTAGALPGRRDAAGVPDEDADIQPADVDAVLERARGDDTHEVARGHAPLDLAPLRRQVAGPVRCDPWNQIRRRPRDP